MKLRLRQVAAFLSSLYFLVLLNLTYAQDGPTQSDLNLINDTIAQVETRIQQTSSKRSDAQTELANTEKNLVRINQEVNSINEKIELEKAQLNKLQQQRQALEKSKSEQQTLVGQYMRNAHRGGQEEYLKLLLNQQNIDQTARILRYYQYFNKARAGKIESFNTTLLELATVQRQIQLSSARLDESREQLNQQLLSLQSTQNERQTLLAQLDANLSSSGAELASLEQERTEMELLIEELNRAILALSLQSQGQDFSALKGKLPWPATGPLLNSYGESYALGDLDWQGVVIAGNEGEEVQAIHQGRVIFSDWFANSGLLLIIDHGDGYMSLYAHNQLLYKAVGDWVNSGELIAAIGNTGGRRENGVYFEIRHNGDAVDPISWCVARN